MNNQELWAAIDEQRARVADMLDDLREDEWQVQSLCEGWSVRDVAAHLTLQQMSFGTVMRVAMRSPGSLNHIIHSSAKRRARMPSDEFAREIRAMIGSRDHNFGVTPNETLIDIIVHGEDMAIPLGRELEISPIPASWAASRVWSFDGRGAAKVFQNLPLGGMRLIATDTAWSVGSGPEIRGPIRMLLLLLTGRRVALAHLQGKGTERLKASLVPR